MPENRGVETGNVDRGEHKETGDNDGPEQKLIVVKIAEEGEFVLSLIRVETKHGAADRLEFPRGDENEPSELSKNGSAGAENGFAGFRVL